MGGDPLQRSTSKRLSRTALETWQNALTRLEAAVGLFLRMTARTRLFVLIAKAHATVESNTKRHL